MPRPQWRDLLAGLSVAGLLLPEAVAYAGIANMPPQAGVMALFAGLLVYGLVGSSRFAIVSATSSSAAVLLAATAGMAGGNMALRLALTGGLVLISGGLLLVGAAARVGAVSAFIAKPVLRGFAFGLALLIITRQLPAMLGVPVPTPHGHSLMLDVWAHPASWHGPSAVVGVGAWLALMGLSRRKGWPAALIVMALGVAAQRIWLLDAQGVSLVGPINLSWQAPQWPDLVREQWQRLGEVAVALVLILYAESNGSIRALALRHGDATQPNRDLLALGLANVLSAVCHGMPVGAGYSASTLNEASGARTPWAGLLAALVLLALIGQLLPAVADMPQPVLAAIVVHAVSHTLSPQAFRPYFVWRRDRLLALGAVAGVLWLGVLDGLLVAIGASLFMTLRGMAQASVAVLGRLADSHDFIDMSLSPQARQEPDVLILRPEAGLFFGNVDRLLGDVRAEHQRQGAQRQLILSLEESPDLDGTSVEALRDLATALATQGGKRLILARLKNPAYVVLQRAALPGCLLSVLSIDDAVAMARQVPSAPLGPVVASAQRSTL